MRVLINERGCWRRLWFCWSRVRPWIVRDLGRLAGGYFQQNVWSQFRYHYFQRVNLRFFHSWFLWYGQQMNYTYLMTEVDFLQFMMILEVKWSLFRIRCLLFKTSRNLTQLEDCEAPTFSIDPKLILDLIKAIHSVAIWPIHLHFFPHC